ncbi:hypothetical protein TRFO_01242 [Tritrichomonas foetus]|uniref:Uncharacterized protein n=1 Tax=Tritrichomonas foetus TaxID=1144522 RepID=A0A1J4K839_9EUKA|nr:hypothetical protein TRFO_01242 [Tritrichomonas foetus]|eukprot:OHT07138.1 hypothetical protein TRFO_01242 [Tritrichomonas foetus]
MEIEKNNYLARDPSGKIMALLSGKRCIRIDPNNFDAIESIDTLDFNAQNQALKSDQMSILYNCNKSFFLIAEKQQPIQIYDSRNCSKVATVHETSFNVVKWSPYATNVLAVLTSSQKNEIKVYSLIPKLDSEKNNLPTDNLLKDQHECSIRAEGDQRITSFTWGEENNLWLKYSIFYASDKKKLSFVRPVLPKQYKFTTREFIRLSSTLNSEAEAIFSNEVKQYAASRVFTRTEQIKTDIPITEQKFIQEMTFSNNKLVCLTKEGDLVVYSINEIENYRNGDTYADPLSFFSTINKFQESTVFFSTHLNSNSPVNFFISDGIFIQQGNDLMRLFNESKLVTLAQFSNIRGACGPVLLLNNDELVKIGQYEDSLKKIEFDKVDKAELNKYIDEIDTSVIQKKLEQAKITAQAIHYKQCVNQKRNDEIKAHCNELENGDEIPEFNEKLENMKIKSEGMKRRLDDLLRKVNAKKSQENSNSNNEKPV